MDYRILGACIVAVLLVSGGVVIAMPVFEKNWLAGHGNQTAGLRMHPNGARFGNATFPDKTQVESFGAAVLSGDYVKAKALHDEYRFGGPIFGMLNETTFQTYSKIANLESELASSLGMNQTKMGLLPLDFRGMDPHPSGRMPGIGMKQTNWDGCRGPPPQGAANGSR